MMAVWTLVSSFKGLFSMIHVVRMTLMVAALFGGFWWLTPATVTPETVDVAFVERSEQAGCKNVHTMVRLADDFTNIMPWLSSVGAAAAAGDFNNDGYADLYATNSGRGDMNRLFRNRGDGTFEDVTTVAGVECGNPEGASMHAVWGDVDNDGRLDLYVTKWAEPNQLFRNNGDPGAPGFTDISREAGVDYWGYGNGATFLDYDRDGRLDLLVGNYFAEAVVDPKTGQTVRNDLWHPVTTRVMHETFTHARNGGRNVLYRNVSEGNVLRFEDVSKAVGMTFTGWTLAVGSGDLNNDGWPDVYVANDFGPDELYLNTGATETPPRFRIVVDPKGHPGVGNDWWKGMNVDMADVNNDGYLDIYVTNILERRYKTDEGNMLWINCVDPSCPGGRGFRNVAEASHTNDGGWGWGGKFADFNNDGLLDIYTVNGFVTGDSGRNYWYAIQEMVTQTKNQTTDARDWPVMGDRDLSGHERGRLFMQTNASHQSRDRKGADDGSHGATPARPGQAPPRSHEGMGTTGHNSEPRASDAKSRPPSQGGPQGGQVGRTSDTPTFLEVAERAGITDTYNGRGIALADFDHDGYIDMYVANQGAPSCYYINMTGRRVAVGAAKRSGFLWIKLVGRPDIPMTIGGRTFASTTDAVGARVTVYAGDVRMTREVQGGMGFASQSEHAVHFGLPETAAGSRITIQWPSGRMQEFAGDAIGALVNHHVRIVEGSNEVSSW
jgi:hypothetical protein